MALVTDAELWAHLNHALRLAEECLDKLNDAREPGLRPALENEVHVRKFVLHNFHRRQDFDGAARVWCEYMTVKAELSARWAAGLVTDDEFYPAAHALLRQRSAALELVRGVPWFVSEGEKV